MPGEVASGEAGAEGENFDSAEEAEPEAEGESALEEGEAGGGPQLVGWAAELIQRLESGERTDARDAQRVTLALSLRAEWVVAIQQDKAERAAAALQKEEATAKAKENAALLALVPGAQHSVAACGLRALGAESGRRAKSVAILRRSHSCPGYLGKHEVRSRV